MNNLSREGEEVFPEREGMATVWGVVCSEMLNTAVLSPCQPWGLCKNAVFFLEELCLRNVLLPQLTCSSPRCDPSS